MPPPDPFASPPQQADLDDALGRATSITLVGGDGPPRRLPAGAREALRPLLRIEGGGATPSWRNRRATVLPARTGRPLGALWVYGDLSVRWASWNAFARVTSPRALGALLAEHGGGWLLRAYDHDRAPEAAAARAAWRDAAPRELGAFLDASPEAEPDRQTIAPLLAARGEAGAAWVLAAWHGSRRGAWREAYSFEAASDAALRALGVHEVIRLAASGVPAEARAGAARFLVDNVTTRGWGLDARIPAEVRAALVEAARASGAEDNGVRAARLLQGEGALAPPGTTLVAAAETGSFRGLVTDGTRAFAADGDDLVRIEAGRGATPVTKLFRPSTPIAVQGGEVRFLQPNGVERVRADGGEVKRGRGPLFDLPSRRLPRAIEAFAAKRDEVLGRATPAGADLLVLDPDADAAAAYAAFGGDLPAAMRLGAAYACDVARGALIEAPWRKPSREVSLGGRPVWLGATETGVIVVVARGGGAAIVTVDEGGPARTLGTVPLQAENVLGVLRVGDGAWVRLWAPLGEVLVALAPAR